jgi:serine/threonine protein kinase/tetratricopeptide (TPR) repeat protein
MHSGVISHYRIIRKLGQGGMGEVYLADDSVLGRKVAVKVLPEDSVKDDQARRRLLREARAAATLDHPNICSIHEVGDEDGTSFIVMQYVEGQTLSERLREKPMSLKESLDIASQIASALEEAHSRGIVHRDIKPQNIIITPRGLVKVLDFGLAKILPVETDASAEQTQSLLTDAGMVIGTAPYMSPEQAKCGPVDARSDLFSLGAVLYECVTGTPAFSGSTPMEICARVIHEDPPAPSKLNRSIPSELDRLIVKLLNKKAEARYQSASELRADLSVVGQTLGSDEQVSTRPVRAVDRVSRISAIISASSVVARRPRVYIPTLVVALAIPTLFLIRASLQWSTAPHQLTPEAKWWYDAGVNAIRQGSYCRAAETLGHAVDVDATFPLSHARLAEAWAEIDYTDRAKDEMLRASKLVLNGSKLTPLESAVFDAVNSTVTNDLDHAIACYAQILAQSADQDRPYAYVDIGRAYEKNDEVEMAAQSYLAATKLDSRNATAFLRLGELESRRRDFTVASGAFDTAESLYRATGNEEGVAEVVYQRGAFYDRAGRLGEAGEQLLKALNISRAINSEYQEIRALLALSGVSRNAGDASQAVGYVTDAINLAQKNGVENLVTEGFIDLGQVFMAHNRTLEAGEYFKKALDFAERFKARRNEGMALLALANLAMQRDDGAETQRFIEQALPIFQEGGYRKENSQALSLLGHATDMKGDYETALRAFSQQLDVAQQAGDLAQLAVSREGLGIVLAHKNKYPKALENFKAEYDLSKASGERLRIGYSQLDCADMLWRLGRYSEAGSALGEALSIAEEPNGMYKQLSQRALSVQARMELSEGKYRESVANGMRALIGSDSTYTWVDAKSTVGLAEVFLGQRRQGIQSCEAALATATRMADPRTVAIARLSLAEAELAAGEPQAALANALMAQPSFASTGQVENEWWAWLIAGEANLRSRNVGAGRAQLQRARAIIRGIEEEWGTDSYRGYLNRADVASGVRRLEAGLSEGITKAP